LHLTASFSVSSAHGFPVQRVDWLTLTVGGDFGPVSAAIKKAKPGDRLPGESQSRIFAVVDALLKLEAIADEGKATFWRAPWCAAARKGRRA
jgi:hypothetical protein